MEKLKCVKNRFTGEIQRVSITECEQLINSEHRACSDGKERSVWHYTSKSAYEVYLNSLNEKHPSGIFGDSRKKGKQIKEGNNRKTTRGRLVTHIYLPSIKFIRKVGYALVGHRSKIHTEQREHKLLVTKEGKAFEEVMSVVPGGTISKQTKPTSIKQVNDQTRIRKDKALGNKENNVPVKKHNSNKKSKRTNVVHKELKP